MTSNHLRGPTAFKPTPSTCYPPPPPPPPRGFVPCIGHVWAELASLTAETSLSGPPPVTPGGEYSAMTNVANTTRGAGITSWAATMNNAQMSQLTIGIRCVQITYGGHQWQTMAMGTIVASDGTRITGTTPWFHNTTVTITPTPKGDIIEATLQNPGKWQNGRYTSGKFRLRLTEIPTVGISRPPNPMIPPMA